MFQAFSRGDATNLESPRATVTQIQNLEVAALALSGHSDSWRATLMQIRDLEVATFAPFGKSESRRATVTPIRGLHVATFASAPQHCIDPTEPRPCVASRP